MPNVPCTTTHNQIKEQHLGHLAGMPSIQPKITEILGWEVNGMEWQFPGIKFLKI